MMLACVEQTLGGLTGTPNRPLFEFNRLHTGGGLRAVEIRIMSPISPISPVKELRGRQQRVKRFLRTYLSHIHIR